MCLAIPGRIADVYEAHGTRMAHVDFGGILKEVCLAYLPDATVGTYVIVHVGFAINTLDEEAAKETLRHFEEMGVLADELQAGDPIQ